MEIIDAKNSKLFKQSLKRLMAFRDNPRDPAAWEEARIALGQIGDAAGRLLANRPQEDAAFGWSVSELDGCAEALRRAVTEDTRSRFDVSLGDVKYRLQRLFGVVG
jgi:hypothetical protein